MQITWEADPVQLAVYLIVTVMTVSCCPVRLPYLLPQVVTDPTVDRIGGAQSRVI